MSSEICQESTEERDPIRERRLEIERVDQAIVALVHRRVRLAREIGRLKTRTGMPLLDPAREAAVIRRVGALARGGEVPEDGIRQIFWQVIGLCRRAQMGES
jgi:chorismate mutase / prephenate dehydratase